MIFVFRCRVKSKKAANANRDTEDGEEDDQEVDDEDAGKSRYQAASGSEESVMLLCLQFSVGKTIWFLFCF